MGVASGDSQYELERVLTLQEEIFDNRRQAVRVIERAGGSEVIEFLLGKHPDHSVREPIDMWYDDERKMGSVRKALLQSVHIDRDLKRDVVTRQGDPRELSQLVPTSTISNALGALATGKPIVLYGPTGTGKTTLAKQLALETCVGYDIHTASPSWTDQDIIGRIAPDYSSRDIRYVKEPGCVSKAVQRSRNFNEKWAVIIDELTRADISRVFGPLYTAIEDPSQTLFETEDQTIELDPEVDIICTINVSDRTVNELDNAITRRFAMIEISSYDRQDREQLFRDWTDLHLPESTVDTDQLVSLLHTDYERLNSDTSQGGSGLMQFGPMHYEDVVKFLGKVCAEDGSDSEPGVSRYSDRPAQAIGEAFRIYILPRLLNEASYPQIRDLTEHYQGIDEEFDQVDLSPATNLAEQRYRSEQQRMGGV